MLEHSHEHHKFCQQKNQGFICVKFLEVAHSTDGGVNLVFMQCKDES